MDLVDTKSAWRVDLAGRAVNWNWRVYPIYISFTELDDGTNTGKCDAETYGPQSAKYCGDGGVYYLNMYDTQSGGGAEPYGVGDLAVYGLEAETAMKSSVEGWKAHGNKITMPDIHIYDDVANQEILTRLARNTSDVSGSTLLTG